MSFAAPVAAIFAAIFLSGFSGVAGAVVEGSAAAADAAYLQELTARARERRLAEDPYWLRLLHTRPHRFGSVESTIDFPDFFRAPDGKRDPATELAATLAAFFASEPIAGEPPQCRYRARYQWLRDQLGFDPARLPPQRCTFYDDWLAGLDPGAVHIVFASNDLDSPSSMFGHTLLRIDGRGRADNQRLLAYAVNYAAETSREDGVTYALKGLTGAYHGYYAVMPYYDKVKQYQGYDHRDLWEYRLRLDPAQRERLLAHLWELRGVGSDYYFFTENCSYQLLALLEAARPDVDLTSHFERLPPYTIPLDTVRALARADLLDPPEYQASNARRLGVHYAQLPAPAQAWVRAYLHAGADLADRRYAEAGASTRAGMLEVAHDALYLAFQDGSLPREQGLPRDRALLLARSGISEDAGFAPLAAPRVAPDAGHGSGRVSLGLRSDDRRSAAELRVRPAYHDRLDSPGGYMAGGEISFLDLGLLVRDRGPTLADATLLSVQALAPRNDLLKPISWQIATGVRRYGSERYTADGRGALGEFVDGGPGLSWTPAAHVQSWLFALAAIDANHDLAKGYAIGGGVRAGIAWQWREALSVQLEGDCAGVIAGSARPQRSLRGGAQWHFDPNDGLRVEARYTRDQRRETTSFGLAWEHYF